MIACSIPQPFCTLIANRARRVMVLPRGTEYRGSLMLHAESGWLKSAVYQPFAEDLKRLGYSISAHLPSNELIATARLTSVTPLTDWSGSFAAIQQLRDVGMEVTGGFVYEFSDVMTCPPIVITNDPTIRKWQVWLGEENDPASITRHAHAVKEWRPEKP